MQIVIDIPEKIYKNIQSGNFWLDSGLTLSNAFDLIKNGTPLPKGHGKLGDLDKIKKDMQSYRDDCATTSKYTRLGFETAIAVVEDADTIIEADKAETQ